MFLRKGGMISIFYYQQVNMFNNERRCQDILPRNVSLIYKLQDSLNIFSYLILLDSE